MVNKSKILKMKFQKFMIIFLLVGLQSGYFDCIEPPRVREYDADVPNIYNGGLKVDDLSEGNEKMAKFIDSSRVELSLDQFSDDSYIQAYKLTNENYQNDEEQLSIDVARENRAHLERFRVKRDAPNSLESIKFEVSDAKTPDSATLEVMRTKKELRNVRSPYEVVENSAQSLKSNRMGYRAKVTSPRLYNGDQTQRYGSRNDYNRALKPQPMSYRKVDTPEFGAKLWWNPSELSRYKRLQHRVPLLPNASPSLHMLHNGIAQPTQHTHLIQHQPPQHHYVTAFIPYQEVKSVPAPQAPLYNQQSYNMFDTQKYNYPYNQFSQFEKQLQPQQQQQIQKQFQETNPYGPVELHYDQSKTQYASIPKLDPNLEVLQSLLGQDPKHQLQGLQELLNKEGQYQQQQLQQQQYQQQQQFRPQDSTAPVLFHPSNGGQINDIPVTKPPLYQYTVAGSTKQIVPIPTPTTTFAPLPNPTTVAPTTLHYQDLLPSSTPAPFSVVTIDNSLKLLPGTVHHGPETQNALIHSHQHHITPKPLLLKSQHTGISLNSLPNHNQQLLQQQNGDGSSEHDNNHDVSIKASSYYSYVVHNPVKRSAPKWRPVRQRFSKIPPQRGPVSKVEYYFTRNPEYDFFIIRRIKKAPKRPQTINSLPDLRQISSNVHNVHIHTGEVFELQNNYKSPEPDRQKQQNSEPEHVKEDESSPVEYEVLYDENEFYYNRHKILNLTAQLRKKNKEFFENFSDDIVETENSKVTTEATIVGAGERLKYEDILSTPPSSFHRRPKYEAADRIINIQTNATDTKQSDVNSSDLNVNSTLLDPEGEYFNDTENIDELDDMVAYFFDENGTRIENFDELNMATNESRLLYHLMPVQNTIEDVFSNTSSTDQVSAESQSISDRSSYAYGWDDDEDDDDDDQYIDDEDDDEDEYEEEKPRKFKIIKWRPRKSSNRKHHRQKYKIVPVTVYKKIPIKSTRRHKSEGNINIHKVNIYEKPPPRKIIHHRPEWHLTQTIKHIRKHRYRKPYYHPRKRTKFNKVAWLLPRHYHH